MDVIRDVARDVLDDLRAFWFPVLLAAIVIAGCIAVIVGLANIDEDAPSNPTGTVFTIPTTFPTVPTTAYRPPTTVRPR